jgi:hypothetical protein
MGKIILGNLVRHLITLLIGFFVARRMLSQDVAAKLYAGDTVELWHGVWSIDLKQVVDFIMVAIIPALVPMAAGIWTRIKARYSLIVARFAPYTLTAAEVKRTVSAAPISTIVQRVAENPK